MAGGLQNIIESRQQDREGDGTFNPREMST